MNHHAFFATGTLESVREALIEKGIDDIIVLTYVSFSIDEARKVMELGARSVQAGKRSALVISADRVFHEAQNALLKVFEEPPEGLVLVLAVPSEGVIIPTLRSRLLPLKTKERTHAEALRYLRAGKEERAEMVEKIITRSKSDASDEKNRARREALALAEGLAASLYPQRAEPAVRAALSDLDHVIPLLNDRSAPLKPILEHLSLVVPQGT